jgi:hypothetical protein
MEPEKPSCERLSVCPIFRTLRFEASKTIFIKQYCEGDCSACARYQRWKAGQPVPETLLPNGVELRK